MSNRVYVGNLSWSTSWQDLKDHMRDAGDVQFAKILQDREGRSKGCGIVEFSTPEGAKDAIEKLTDTELKGRKIFVREDREDGNKRGGGGGPPPETTSGGGGGGGGGGDRRRHDDDREPVTEGTSLFVGNLSWETGWQDLKDHFRQIGEVEFADIASGRDGRSRGFGFIRFENPDDAKKAIDELNEVEFMGRNLIVKYDNKA